MASSFHKFIILIGLAVVAIFSETHLVAKDSDPVAECPYTVKEDDSLSMILYKAGIRKSQGYPLYGKGCWVEINQDANPQISNWRRLLIGDQLRIIVPSKLQFCKPTLEPPPVEIKPMNVEAETLAPPKATPAPAEDLGSPPPSSPSPPPTLTVPSLTAPPLTTKKLAKPKQRAKKTKRDNHWLRDRLSSIVSLRYGRAMPSDEYILLPKIRQWSGVYESRHQPLSKIRVYFDYIPRVLETFLGNDYYLESSKLQVGRAFLMTPWKNGTFEVVPKLGYWSYHAVLPDFVEVESDAVELKIQRQLNLGLDLSIDHSFGILKPRIVTGVDATMGYLGVGSKDSAGGTSYLSGLELAVTGPSMKWSTTTLTTVGYLFGNFENVRITRGTKTTFSSVKDTASNPAQQDSTATKDMSYNVNIFGCGLGLAW